MTTYDPELTFEANAEEILNSHSAFSYRACVAVAEALRAAYEDGWLDARAKQMAGCEISECPDKC